MRTDRWLLGALVFLVGGIWILLAWCQGNVGMSVAYPVASTKLTLDVVSIGLPVLVGIPLIFLGLVMMFIAFIAAIFAQFHRPDSAQTDAITRLRIPFGE